MDQRSFLFPGAAATATGTAAAAARPSNHHSEAGAIQAVNFSSHCSSSSSHGFVTAPPAVDMDEQLRGVGLSAAARGMTMVMIARNEDSRGGGHGPHQLFGGGGGVYFVQANPAGGTGAPLFFAAPSSSSPMSSSSSPLQMVPAVLFQPPALPYTGAAAPMGYMDPGRSTAAAATTTTFTTPVPPVFAGMTAASAAPPPPATAGGGGSGLDLLLEASRIQERRSQEQEQEHPVDSASRERARAPAAAKRKSLPLHSKSRKTLSTSPLKDMSSPANAPHSPTDGANGDIMSKKRKKKDKHKNKKKKKSKVVLAKYGIMDVLCGRGGLANRHDGNLVYRKVVDSNKAQYRTLNKRLRGYLAESIVMAIRQAGGRFLEQQNPISKRVAAAERAALEGPNSHVGTSTFVSHRHDLKMADKDVMWVEISFKKAVLKTSQALRETDKSTTGRHGTKAARASVPEKKPRSVVPPEPQPSSSPMRVLMNRTPTAPMARPAPRLLPPTMTSKSSVSDVVVAPDPINVGGTSSTSSRETDPPRSPAASPSASSASSRSLSHYHDAAQEASTSSTDGSAKIDKSGPGDHDRQSNASLKPAAQDDDEHDDMAEDEDMEDDDEYSSTTSSSVSSAASTGPSSSRRSSTTGPPRSVVAFVPVASSHLALSQAYLPSVERNKKR